MGLRHNFAGSLSSEISSKKEYEQELNNYLNNELYKVKKVSNSVMDYFNDGNLFFLGSTIKDEILSYDLQAINYAYKDISELNNSLSYPYFCEDTMVFKNILGCQIYDSGKNPFSFWVDSLKSYKENFSKNALTSLLSEYLYTKNLKKRSLKSTINNYEFDIFHLNKNDQRNYALLIFNSIKNNSILIETIHELGEKNILNKKIYEQKNALYLVDKFNNIGGLITIFKNSLGDNLEVINTNYFEKELNSYINSEEFKLLNKLNGKELTELKTYIPILSFEYEINYINGIIKSLTGGLDSDSNVHYLSYLKKVDWSSFIEKMAKSIILKNKENTKTFEAYYPIEIRLSALRFFSDQLFSQNNWLLKAENDVRKFLHKNIKKYEIILKKIHNKKIHNKKNLNIEENYNFSYIYNLLQNENILLKKLNEIDNKN